MDLKLDTKLTHKLVEEHFDLIKALKSHNPHGRYAYGQPAMCPFHDNTDTPAAAIYKSTDDRPDSLYCFAEQRQYTVADVLGMLMGYNIYEVGHAIWNNMSKYDKEQFILKHSRRDNIAQAFGGVTQISVDDQEIVKKLHGFKMGNITLNEALQSLIDKEIIAT